MKEIGLGWKLLIIISSALSLLNVMRDANIVEIQNTLARWLDVYSDLVRSVLGAMFGWINIPWFHLTEIEMHMALIYALMYSIFLRVAQQAKNEPSSNSVVQTTGVDAFAHAIVFLFYLVISGVIFGFLRLEDQAWLLIAIIFLFVLPLWMGYFEHGFPGLRLAATILVQIGGMVAAFTLINGITKVLLPGPT